MSAAEGPTADGRVQSEVCDGAVDPNLRSTAIVNLTEAHEVLVIDEVVLHLCHTFHGNGPGKEHNVTGGVWRIFLVVANAATSSTSSGDYEGPRSVELKIYRQSREPGKCDGCLEIAARMYPYSTKHEVAKATYPVQSRQLTAGVAKSLLLNKKRDQYRFNSKSKGCSFWVATVIGDLENAGYLAKGTREAAEAFIVANGPKSKLPAMVSVGAFY